MNSLNVVIFCYSLAIGVSHYKSLNHILHTDFVCTLAFRRNLVMIESFQTDFHIRNISSD